MDFEHLRERGRELLDYLESEGYTRSYIRIVRQDLNWIADNGESRPWRSYLDAYRDRVSRTESKLYRKNHKIAFGAIQQFALYGEYPNRRVKNCLVEHGAYHQLIPEFKKLVDHYREEAALRGLEESTIGGDASSASCFFLAMQKRGLKSLADVGEDDALSFFLDDDGNLSKCSSYKKQVAAVLRAAPDGEGGKDVLALLPPIRPRRRNVQFLTREEVDAIRSTLDDASCPLSLRDRAIGRLLLFTGLRACDVAGMELGSIDWESDVIGISQRKTGQPLVLPLAAPVGNAICDYLVDERPTSDERRLFLGTLRPHRPFGASNVYHVAMKVYDAAGVRQKGGDRRGTHLFRHNVATSLLSGGVPAPIISSTLGHADPCSLNPYLHADIAHLRECALSIERFPVDEGVFRI